VRHFEALTGNFYIVHYSLSNGPFNVSDSVLRMNANDVLFRREGALGRITLNRLKALNALTLEMCAAMLEQLQAWADDPAIRVVVIDAAPGRAFCAGGDIRAVYDGVKRGDGSAAQFFATEYRLNAAIRRYPKLYIPMMDGIAMGGATGISVHGPFRVAGENTAYAMPETAIGLIPDVGGTYVLPLMPGEIGMYLGLTGTRISLADILHTGIATHFVPAERFGDVRERLAAGEAPGAVLSHLAENVGAAPLAEKRAAIDRVFSKASVEAILEALNSEGAWGQETAALLATRSPIGLKLTYRALRQGRGIDFAACQQMEYRVMTRAVEAHDFHEGVRAALIDKDQRPRWQPANLREVSDADVEFYFAPLDGHEFVT
jgi:enoyl-CoA hydratase/carnithine racemase